MKTSTREGNRTMCVVVRSHTLLLAILVSSVLGLANTTQAASGSQGDDGAVAEESAKEQLAEVWDRDLFTGDWEGWRTALQEHGIDPHFRLSQYGQWVADGGVETDGGYAGTMDYRVDLDLMIWSLVRRELSGQVVADDVEQD